VLMAFCFRFTQTPLGIKAVIVAIYEPPQECSRDHIRLIPDENEGRVDELAQGLGLTRVGWIFTDLVNDSSGQVKHFRNIDSHFLSAQECIMAGFFQNKFPNVTKLSSSGKHGSKFVTVVVTGSADRSVHMEGYQVSIIRFCRKKVAFENEWLQVSNQCMALVRENILLPTKDAPELGYVRESSSKQYVPDVFFKEKDKYGNEVTKLARPLPVE
jgi:nuclear protein localization family protein 4